MKQKYFLIFGIIVLGAFLISGCIKPDIECSNSIQEPAIPINTVREYTPDQFKNIINNGSAIQCVNNTLLRKGSRVFCEACGWICARDSPYFWKFTYNNDTINIFIWDVQCEGKGLEFRLPDQKIKQGIKVSLPT